MQSTTQHPTPFVLREDTGCYKATRELSPAEILDMASFIAMQSFIPGKSLSNVRDSISTIWQWIGTRKNEVFITLFLDNKHRIIRVEELFHGTIDSSSVHPRVVVQKALDFNAAALVETGEAEHEEQGWTMASEDQFLLDDEWNVLLFALTEKLNEINPEGYWHGEVKNFGWRKTSGIKDFEADTAQAFLSAILPQIDCTFHLYIDESHPFKEIKIQNFHHDSPTGNEWYTIVARDALEEAA